jgi:3',5'-cyclic AMP phosphodiesterase CpdA
MLEHDYDVFLHLGDMAYGDGTFPEFKERVFDVYTDLLHKTPTWPTMGNHEYNTDQGQPYLDVYYLPEMALNPDQHEQYYSFDYGDVHFISLQSNDAPLITSIALDGLSDTTMLDWLRADLAASDKPWKIAFFHHPPYTSSERDPNVIVRGSLLPILEEGGVDLVLSGHDHHYERSEPVRGGVPARHEDGGIVYFVAGAGGAGLRETDAQWWTEEIDDTRHSYLSIRISGCTAYGEVIALDGEQLDTFELPGC